MREILFRGKRHDNLDWVEGYLLKECNYETCSWNLGIEYKTDRFGRFAYEVAEVVPYTVGQFTGMTDKNGKRIFEGDVIKADNGYRAAVAVVKFGENYPTMFYTMMDVLYAGYEHLPAISFYAETIDKHQHLILFQSPCVEVIGNIHDNPELIGERKDNE